MIHTDAYISAAASLEGNESLSHPNSFDEEVDRTVSSALKVHPMIVGEDSCGVFTASIADMDFKVAPVIVKALQDRLDHCIFGYEAVPKDLYPAVINWMQRRYNWHISQPHILRAPNVLNTLSTAAAIFANPGDGVIIQPPVFFDFYDILQENRREIILNPLILRDGKYYMDLIDLESKARQPAAKILFLCSPHNPTGRVWTREELIAVGDICLRHGVIVVADEIHSDITLFGHKHTPFASLGNEYASNCISCVSPAKSFNIASCCQSFAIISDDTRRATFRAENSRLNVNKNNAFASAAMVAAYSAAGEDWLASAIKYIEKNVEYLEQELESMPGVAMIRPEGTFLVWMDFRSLNLTPTQQSSFLRDEAKWVVNRGEAFGDEGRGFARVNIACSRVKLRRAVHALREAVMVLSK
mmetsp:Transcript_4084/g.6329  ORF Transcript_4084/g.6329 Transcript_4084/m.6329 type:complete len:415 (-) Transcript_4084:168-1412(-)